MKNARGLTLTLLLAATLAGMHASPARADRLSTVTMEQMQQDIRSRIQYGLAQGLITPQEAQALYQRERDIQFREMRYRRNPHASPRERDALWRDLEAMRVDVERRLNRHDGRRGAPGLAQRQAYINNLIDHGIADGLIAQNEAHWLQRRQRDISRREAQLRANGRFNRAEQERLQHDLDALEWEVNRLLDRANAYR